MQACRCSQAEKQPKLLAEQNSVNFPELYAVAPMFENISDIGDALKRRRLRFRNRNKSIYIELFKEVETVWQILRVPAASLPESNPSLSRRAWNRFSY